MGTSFIAVLIAVGICVFLLTVVVMSWNDYERDLKECKAKEGCAQYSCLAKLKLERDSASEANGYMGLYRACKAGDFAED